MVFTEKIRVSGGLCSSNLGCSSVNCAEASGLRVGFLGTVTPGRMVLGDPNGGGRVQSLPLGRAGGRQTVPTWPSSLLTIRVPSLSPPRPCSMGPSGEQQSPAHRGSTPSGRSIRSQVPGPPCAAPHPGDSPATLPTLNCACTQPSLLRKTFQEASYQERPFPFKFSLFQTFLNLTPLQCLQNLCQKPDRTSVPCRGPFGECGFRRQCVNQNVLFKCDFFHPEPPPRCL